MSGQAGPFPGRWAMLALIWLVFVIHGVDRSVVLVLLEPMRQEFGLNDAQIGLISGLAYAVPFALAGIPLGALADRVNRARLLAGLLALWSGFTMLAGLASNFALLLLARAGVGASEAGAPPTMLSMIGDGFDDRQRPTALSIYYTAPFVGLMAGSVIAGAIAQSHGWRAALLTVGAPGLVIALAVALLLRQPPRGLSGEGAPSPSPAPSIRATLAHIAGERALRRLLVALVLTAFVTLAVSSWIPVFLQRVHGIPPARTGVLTALTLGLTAVLGSLIGGAVGTRVGRGDAARLRTLCGAVILLAAPLALLAPLMPSVWVALTLFGAWSFIGTAYMGPGWGIALATTPAHMRATVMGVAIVMTNLIGAGLGPPFVGLLSDLLARAGDAEHLQHAMAVTTLFSGVSAWLFLAWPRSRAKEGERAAVPA